MSSDNISSSGPNSSQSHQSEAHSPSQGTLTPLSPPLPARQEQRDLGAPMEDIEVIIIDAGSDRTKAGFSMEAEPRVIFPTIVGRPR